MTTTTTKSAATTTKKSRKIPLAKRNNTKERSTTFTKRRQGLFSKSAELCNLFSGVQIAVIVRSINPNKPNHFYSFGHTSADNVIEAFLDNTVPVPVPVPVPEQQLQQQQIIDFDAIDSIEDMEYLIQKLNLLKEDVQNRIKQLSSSELINQYDNAVVVHSSVDDSEADFYQFLNNLDYAVLHSSVHHSEPDFYQFLNNFDYDDHSASIVPIQDILFNDDESLKYPMPTAVDNDESLQNPMPSAADNDESLKNCMPTAAADDDYYELMDYSDSEFVAIQDLLNGF
ncbi:hypothetical protein ACFE04_000262 [Oxalis oulophora]